MPSNERRKDKAEGDAARDSGAGRQHESGRFAYEGLDRVIHEKARLGIMTSLVSSAEGLAFTDLKELCGLTDGNLNRHLEVLREAGLIKVEKETRGKGRARTLCRATAQGRARFLEYLAELERAVADAAAAAAQAERRTVPTIRGRLSTT